MPNTAWMWNDDTNENYEVWGATLDPDDQRINWYDNNGCSACGDSRMNQTFANFLKFGPRFVTPPTDILEEIRDLTAFDDAGQVVAYAGLNPRLHHSGKSVSAVLCICPPSLPNATILSSVNIPAHRRGRSKTDPVL